MRRQDLLLWCGVAALTACRSTPPAPHTHLETLVPLQTAFNADSGKVRAIFLASPT